MGTIYRFGPFQLDSETRRLTRGDDYLHLNDRYLNLLFCFVENPRRILTKDELVVAGWGSRNASDESLSVAIHDVRRALDPKQGRLYIATLPRQGYRFDADVARTEVQRPLISPEEVEARHRAFVQGVEMLPSLRRDDVEQARLKFEQALKLDAGAVDAMKAAGHAWFFTFESTRAHATPDMSALQHANRYAERACELDPQCGHSWGLRALVAHRLGDPVNALIYARTGVACDRDDWRNHFRHTMVAWGDDRLAAARRTLAIKPQLAQAHWFAAGVHVARQADDEALRELTRGAAIQDTQGSKFPAIGLHWLRALVLARKGALDEAVAEVERELAIADEKHLYGPETLANGWYVLGGFRRLQSRQKDAKAAFAKALTYIPSHPLSRIAQAGYSKLQLQIALKMLRQKASQKDASTNPANLAFAIAMVLTLMEKYEEAAQTYADALAVAPAGSTGWLLPVDPILNVSAHPAVWARALALLADRAS